MEYPDVLQYRLMKEANVNPNYINKRLNTMGKGDVLNNVCLSSFTKKEIDKYLFNYYPQQICEFTITPDVGKEISYYNGLFRRSGGKKSYEYSYIDCEIFEYVKIFQDDFNDRIGKTLSEETQFWDDWISSDADEDNQVPLPEGTSNVGYDLVTTYYVLKNRMSCDDQGFAKKTVIDSLDYIYQNAKDETLFLYLLCNGFMMGIHILSKYTYFISKLNYEEDMKEIRLSIKVLYSKIRRYLENLDDEKYKEYPKYILEDSKKYVKSYEDFYTIH